MQLAEPELYVIMENLIDRIFKQTLQSEKVFNYNYFVKAIYNIVVIGEGRVYLSLSEIKRIVKEELERRLGPSVNNKNEH
jgi:large-conductance mechanosensitive channel